MSFYDYRDEVYAYVAAALRRYRSDITVGSILEPDHASFPVAFCYEIGSRRIEQYVNLGYTDEQCESTFEIQVASNALNGAATEANGILDAADAAMNDCGYIRYSRARIDNADRRVFRVYARYRRVIGGADAIPVFEYTQPSEQDEEANNEQSQ